jgi:hypothetical protein
MTELSDLLCPRLCLPAWVLQTRSALFQQLGTAAARAYGSTPSW